jgi:polysaccharide export outer membrane protein
MMVGCNYNSSVVFKLPSDYAYATDTVNAAADYKILPFDKLAVRVLVNNGSRLVDISAGVANPEVTSGVAGNAASSNGIMDDLKVDKDGFVRLPIFGLIGVKGMTVIEAEKLIEDRFSKNYVDPFVTVTVKNRRVIIFPGNGGEADVVNLTNENISVIEVLALNGGINLKGKSKKVRLARKVGNEFKIYNIDLSKEAGISNGQMTVCANDIIYIEQTSSLSASFATEFSVALSALTSLFLLYDILTRNP